MLLPMIESTKELFSFSVIFKFSIVGLINTVFMLLISYKFFQALQQFGYKGADYYKWVFTKDNQKITRLSMLSLLSILGFILTNMAFSFLNSNIVAYLGFIWYIFFTIIYIKGQKIHKNKIPLIKTKRLIRLSVTFTIITIIFNVLLSYLVNVIALIINNPLLMNFRYAVLCLLPVFVPYLVLLAYLINNPYEKHHNKRYVVKAKNVLDNFGGIKIAITGSYAKTSVKQILTTILSEKYNVLATPESYNTPLGIAKTCNRLNNSYDVFIAEMGARHLGDVKELTEMVNPTIALITGITSQHLETFLTINNVKKAKYEVVENMKDGFVAFSNDNPHTIEMYSTCPHKKVLAGINSENASVYAKDISYSIEGTSFTLCHDNESVKCTTCLIGENAVSNIVLASSVGLHLGLSLVEIAVAITKIEPIKHRLQVTKTINNSYIIDDSYNSNPEGIKKAVEVLKLVKGKKYVVTPGMIELGLFENQENYKFGILLAGVCDKVLLVKRGGTLSIREGLLSQGFDKNNIIMIQALEESKKFLQENLQEGDGVLFENDLPDVYTE